MTNKSSRPYKGRASRLLKYKWLIVALAIVVVFGVLELNNTIDIFKTKPTPGTIPSQSRSDPPSSEDTTEKGAGAESKPQAEPATTPPKQDTPPTTPPGKAPLNPYGDFVSNHHPNLGGHPAPSRIASVCNTTPGASCYIELTNKDGVVKKLAAQTTDSSGATYWEWDIKEAGLSTGSWGVKAVATLNGKTSTAKDAQNIEVEP